MVLSAGVQNAFAACYMIEMLDEVCDLVLSDPAATRGGYKRLYHPFVEEFNDDRPGSRRNVPRIVLRHRFD